MNCANHPDVERAAFCQNCGKPLCKECMRTVGSAVYCEPCLEARLAASSANAGAPFAAAPPYAPAGAASGASSAGANYAYSGAVPPSAGPNPMLAGLLGFIPGVGAMFNGQFVKALVHIVIFGVLVSLADKADFFGILIAGWVFYQVFDAYQTAKARRDGDPLPDPFGLNTLGDRIGFGGVSRPAATPYSPPYGASAAAPAGPPPYGPGSVAGAAPFTPASSAPYDPAPFASAGAPPASYASYPYASPAGYAPVAYDNVGAPQHHPLPVGAIVLIGLGVFFLLGTMDVLNTRWLGGGWPFLLIGLGIWILVHRLQGTGSLHSDGSATHRWHVLRALCFPVWVIILTGLLALLDSWHVLRWDVGWAFYLITWGVLVLAMRTATAQMQQESFAAAQAQATAQTRIPCGNDNKNAPSQDAATGTSAAVEAQPESADHWSNGNTEGR